MPEAIRTRKCPICGAPVDWKTAPHRPFCSDRCKLIDLGAWASGRYAIPGPEVGGHAEGEPEVEAKVEDSADGGDDEGADKA